jgi:Protein of unknown function (DUF2934)
VKTQEEDMYTESGSSQTKNEDREAIARLAYFYWEARGCHNDSPDEDWFRAEAELRNRLGAGTTQQSE